MSARWRQLVRAVGMAAAARQVAPEAEYLSLGRFELVEWIGGGGMGVVFRARDTKLGREVALKLWKLPGEEAERAVLHEAQCLAKLSHPNVVAVYETGKVGDDVFLTMEYVDGVDARDWLNRYLPSWRQLLDLYVPAGRGLAAAHDAGLEHSDFKPENILLGHDGRVRVADFGVARALREHVTPEQDELAAEDSAGLGTMAYMAPERLEGRRGDARSDQFSFCVSLWEGLYGARPFDGKTPVALLEDMRRTQPREGTALAGIPRRLREVVLRGLAIDPEHRFPDMAALLAALADVGLHPQRWQRRLELGAWVLAAVIAGSGLTALALTLRDGSEPTKQRQTKDASGSDRAPQPERVDAAPERLPELDDASPEVPRGREPPIEALIEQGELERARQRWLHAEAADPEVETFVPKSLEIAAAFRDAALELEAEDPESAKAAAKSATTVAIYVLAQVDKHSPEAAEATKILTDVYEFTK